MKSNRKLIFICVIIIILGVSYLILSGRLFNGPASKKIQTETKKTDTTKKEIKEIEPIISNFIIKNITTNGATISWKTNTPTTDRVLYDTTSRKEGEYSFSTTLGSSFQKDHLVNIVDLKPKTRIYYKLISIDESGKEVVSSERSFTTKAPPVTTSKRTTSSTKTITMKISSMAVKEITSSEALITWKTNIPATSQVMYSTSSSVVGEYSFATKVETKLITEHNVKLSNLPAGKKIYYQIISIDAKGNKVLSKESSFTVATISISSAPKVTFTTSGGVVSTAIEWKTNVPTNAQIIYGDVSSSAGSYSSKTPEQGSFTVGHSLKINNLMGNVKFYYRIVSTDDLGLRSISQEYSFTTPIASHIVEENLKATSVKITWKTTIATKNKIIFGTISGTSYPLTTEIESSATTSHGITLTGLLANTKYYYRIVSSGTGISNSTSEERSFTTLKN